jgi:cell wall assembly regulator SMI1
MANRRNVRSSWQRIDKWLSANSAGLLKALRPGASESALQGAEKRMQITLPEDVRATYRAHDGTEKARVFPRVMNIGAASFGPLTLKQAASLWTSKSHDQGWKNRWRAIAADESGDYQFVDLDETSGAKRGRVMEWNHEEGRARLVAPTLGARLAELAEGFEKGRYVVDDALGMVPAPKRAKIRAPSRASEYPAVRKALAELRREKKFVPSTEHQPAETYARLMKKLDPQGNLFGRTSDIRYNALWSFIEKWKHFPELLRFYRFFEPRVSRPIKGLRFLSVPELVVLNKRHYRPGSFPLVFGLSANGDRFAAEETMPRPNPPVTVYPADYEIAGKNTRQLAQTRKIVAKDLGDFLKKLGESKGFE